MLTGESICDKLFPQETYRTKRNLQFFQNVPQNTKRWIHVYTGSYSETVTELSLIIIHLKLLSVDLLNSILLNYSPPNKNLQHKANDQLHGFWRITDDAEHL